MEPYPISATGADDVHTPRPTKHTQDHTHTTHKDLHMAAQPVRREHVIYSQSENENEAGCFVFSVVSLCISCKTVATYPSPSLSSVMVQY